MKIQMNNKAGFLSFPDIPEWLLWLFATVFIIGLISIAVTIIAGIAWLFNHVRFV